MSKLIPHTLSASVINQRSEDGYIHATAMCKAAGKRWDHYNTNTGTQEFLKALSGDTGIPASRLINSLRGGKGLQGTWVHPKVAIHLAQWLSPEFAVQVTNWVYDWMNGQQPALPRPAGLSNSQRREIQQRIAEGFAQEERRAVYDRLKDHFDVTRYWNIPCARFDEAMALIESFTPCRNPNRDKKVLADKARLEAAIRDLIGFLHLDDNCSHGAFQDRQKIAAFLERALVSGRSSPNSSATKSAGRG